MADTTQIPLVVPSLATGSLPVRSSLELPRGLLDRKAKLRVLDGDGRALPCQARPLVVWPDGSARWVLVLFDPAGASGELHAAIGPDPAPRGEEGLRVLPIEGGVRVETGTISFAIERPPLDVDARDRSVLTGARYGEAEVTGRALDAGLIVTEADGSVYSSQKAGPDLLPSRWEGLLGGLPPLPTYGISVVEAGPVRAIVRVEGRTALDAYRGGLDYLLYVEAYARRSLVRLTVSWLHRDPAPAHYVRDITFRLPLAFPAAEASFGTEKGTCRLSLRRGSRYSLLQKDAARFEAVREDWDGRRFDIASGAASGKTAPGWAQLRSLDGRALSVSLPGFRDEHPTGLSFTSEALELRLWPEEANKELCAKRLLPPLVNGSPEARHLKLAYECLAHHPYQAFMESSLGCMETVQGMQKSREALLELDPAISAERWEKLCGGGELDLPIAYPAPGGGRPVTIVEETLARAADWFVDYPRIFGVSGAFDRGDLYYLVHDDLETAPWRRVMEEHARSGYWNNNEEDPVHGLFLHARHARSPRHQRAAEIMARHLWDIDVRHQEPWGVHTHTEGHCFRSQTWSATDHFWLEGLLDYYTATGAPDLREGVRELARVAAAALTSLVPAETDLRRVALAIAQALRCAEVLEDGGLEEHARGLALAQVEDMTEQGYFADWGSKTGRPRSPSLLFGTLMVEAIGEIRAVRPEPRLQEAALRQIGWFLGVALHPGGRVTDPADTWDGATGAVQEPSPEAVDPVGALQLLACLGHAFRWTGEPRYRTAGEEILGYFCATFRPPLPGAGFGQIRPLVPATALRCIPTFLAAIGSPRA